jgi:UDP-N-acetylglucosamine 2-epimerase
VAERFAASSDYVILKSLDRDVFLSIYSEALFQIGNSSSGIMEAASVPIPAVNVGRRQRGRAHNANVIFTGTSVEEISRGISEALSPHFRSSIKDTVNIYGDGNSASRAHMLIKSIDFSRFFLKREDPLKL